MGFLEDSLYQHIGRLYVELEEEKRKRIVFEDAYRREKKELFELEMKNSDSAL